MFQTFQGFLSLWHSVFFVAILSQVTSLFKHDHCLVTQVIPRDSPEKPAEPESGVREDPRCQLSQSVPVQHRDISSQTMSQQGHVTLLTKVLKSAKARTEELPVKSKSWALH